MTKNKITLTMTGVEAVAALSEGNIGAVNVLVQILSGGAKHDPDCASPILSLLELDSLGIYGSRIWQLYKDVCGQNLGKMLAVLRAYQLGFLSWPNLDEAIGSDAVRGRPLENIDDLILKVQQELPGFRVELAA